MATEGILTPEQRFLIDFNAHWVPAALGLDVPPAAAAAMLGIDEAQFAAYVAEAEAEVRQVAAGLLSRPEVARAVQRLATPPGQTILTIGDSITTYRYGYAELLRALLALQPADARVRFVNVARSGYTSTHGLEHTYSQYLGLEADWVFIMYGVNDCKRFGGAQAGTLVSIDEYRRNVAAIVEAFLTYSRARPVLLTPTPVLERVANANPDFVSMRMSWDNAGIEACARAVREVAARHGLALVDLAGAFGSDPDPELFLPDGLHPGPAGARFILELVLNAVDHAWS